MLNPMSALGNALYLVKTRAPVGVLLRYVRDQVARPFVKKRHAALVAEVKAFARREGFRQDWFSSNVPVWIELFEQCGLRGRPLQALEIGSFEGLSACFFLQQLPEARLICVDTWEGSDEHISTGASAGIEAAFDRHVAPWVARIEKQKGTSFTYFSGPLAGRPLDFLYVDGSHHSEDVMMDALKGFVALKVGGLMVFDDYLWSYYPRTAENPAVAVNGFLRIISGRYRLVHVGYQLALVKTGERSR